LYLLRTPGKLEGKNRAILLEEQMLKDIKWEGERGRMNRRVSVGEK